MSFLDLFEGRRQLLVYHFWFPEDGEPCGGCTMFSDQVSELAHLNARDVTLRGRFARAAGPDRGL